MLNLKLTTLGAILALSTLQAFAQAPAPTISIAPAAVPAAPSFGATPSTPGITVTPTTPGAPSPTFSVTSVPAAGSPPGATPALTVSPTGGLSVSGAPGLTVTRSASAPTPGAPKVTVAHNSPTVVRTELKSYADAMTWAGAGVMALLAIGGGFWTVYLKKSERTKNENVLRKPQSALKRARNEKQQRKYGHK